jgi:Arc/MetJ-type ribon-helix-helix transcriptional regulator
MDQMNVSITDQLAGYVREKVRTGRYNNASEVIRALPDMEDGGERALRVAKPTADDILTDLLRCSLTAFAGACGPESKDQGR